MLPTREWIIKQLKKHDEIVSVEPKGEFSITIHRKKYPPFSSAILKKVRVEEIDIEFVIENDEDVHFVANIPKNSVWTGDAIEVARTHDLGWGGFGDLMSATNEKSVKGFEKKEYKFVERGLLQHDRITRYDRIFDRVFLLFRRDFSAIKIAIVYEYDLTAEHVRDTREKYGDFSLIVKTNPNGNITSNAYEVGSHLGVEILEWGEFYGRLNRP